MARIGEREQQADRHRTDPEPHDLPGDALHRLAGDGADHGAVAVHPLGHLEHVELVDQWIGVADLQVVDIAAALLVLDLHRTPVAGGNEQRARRVALLDERVGRDRRPVQKMLDVGDANSSVRCPVTNARPSSTPREGSCGVVGTL